MPPAEKRAAVPNRRAGSDSEAPPKDDAPDTTWKPPKTAKTDLERSISRVGAIVPEYLKYYFADSNKRHEEAQAKGANGSPVCDQFGYRLNRDRIVKSSRRPNKRYLHSKKYEERLRKEMEDSKRIEEIMGVPKEKVSAALLAVFQDQVACDLDIPFHTVHLPEYEEWHRRGFKLDPKRWQEKASEQENERIMALCVGSAFRD